MAITTLSDNSSALDAVASSISVLEKDACLNAGYGSNLTIDGQVECDASLMSDSGEFGSVGAVAGRLSRHSALPKTLIRTVGVCNPVQLAYAVLKHSLVPSPLGRVLPM